MATNLIWSFQTGPGHPATGDGPAGLPGDLVRVLIIASLWTWAAVTAILVLMPTPLAQQST